jgi:hypothetical protein
MESSMADEMSFHIASYTSDLIRSGVPSAEAERRARVEFGGVEVYKERCREARGLRMLDDLGADLRYACRTLAKSPSFSITAILTLALGIGANTGLFTMVDTLLLRPVPVQDPSSLYQVFGHNAKLKTDRIDLYLPQPQRRRSTALTSLDSTGSTLRCPLLTFFLGTADRSCLTKGKSTLRDKGRSMAQSVARRSTGRSRVRVDDPPIGAGGVSQKTERGTVALRKW